MGDEGEMKEVAARWRRRRCGYADSLTRAK
jgi:hypothetical protein